MELWERLLSESIIQPEHLARRFNIDVEALHRVTERYPMGINPYYLGLIRDQGDPVYLQAVPDLKEITLDRGYDDPLDEERLSPVPNLTHKYPDRVLFLISDKCAMYCRFCNRKRKIGHPNTVTDATIEEGLAYIRGNRNIRDVLISGGDPLLLSNREIFGILSKLRAINHVEIIRIGTRVPCTLPQRITTGLANMLKGFHPLYMNTHFNHPMEVTADAARACTTLSDAGIPLGCQTVLLRGVNDDVLTMKRLFHELLRIRVKPYYLFQADLAKGTAHFWTPIKKGREIISDLLGHTSGLCIPRLMIDLPGGGGKVPLNPTCVVEDRGEALFLKNYLGQEYRYPVFRDEN